MHPPYFAPSEEIPNVRLTPDVIRHLNPSFVFGVGA